MELTRRNLKIESIVVLAFAALTFIHLVFQLIFVDFNKAELPAGADETTLLITKILIMAVSFVLLLPQIYIGIKGLKIAKNPNSSKAHIVWAIILFVVTVIALISPISNIIKQEAVSDNVSRLLSLLVEGFVFFDYIRYASAVAKDCQ